MGTQTRCDMMRSPNEFCGALCEDNGKVPISTEIKMQRPGSRIELTVFAREIRDDGTPILRDICRACAERELRKALGGENSASTNDPCTQLRIAELMRDLELARRQIDELQRDLKLARERILELDPDVERAAERQTQEDVEPRHSEKDDGRICIWTDCTERAAPRKYYCANHQSRLTPSGAERH